MLASAIFFWPSIAQAKDTFRSNNPFSLGINKVDLGWIDPSKARSVLNDMKRTGVKSVRATLTPPFSNVIENIAISSDLDLKVLLNINFNFPPFNLPTVSEQRFGSSGVWPLSRLDPQHALNTLKPVLEEIAKRRLLLSGIEVGNEINWAGFNADLTAGSKDRKDSIGTLASIRRPEDFSKGIMNFAQILYLIHSYVKNESSTLKSLPIYAGAIADVSDDQKDGLNSEYVGQMETLALMKFHGTDEFIDGYSIHFYLSRRSDTNANQNRLKDISEFCNSVGSGKQCSITELGIASPMGGCGKPDPDGAAIIVSGLKELSSLIGHDPSIYYFDWDSTSEPFSIWRCDALTDVGKALFDPDK